MSLRGRWRRLCCHDRVPAGAIGWRCPRAQHAERSRTLFGDMSNSSENPYDYAPGGLMAAPQARTSGSGTWIASGGALLGSVLIGLLGGLIWGSVAPKPTYEVVSRGSADVVNPETSAFITGDLWFCLIAVIGGLIIGVVSYQLAIRKYGPLPMAAVLAGSVIAGCAARWAGQNLGLAQFNNQLLTSHLGALLHAPPVLGADPSIILWPAIAWWPLAACVVPAGLVLLAAWRDRSAAPRRGAAPPY
jgi:hypothetical protein